MKYTVSLLSILISATQALAAESSGFSTAIHHHYQAPRALGMGDAFVAVANDYSALFYNPAGLARIQENDLNMSFDLAATPEIGGLLNDINEAQNTPGSDSDKQAAMVAVLEENYGKRFGFRVGSPQAIWARPGWAIGVIPMDLTIRLGVHGSVGPAIAATAYADTTVAYGYGANVKGFDYGKLSWGVTAKAIHRGYFGQNVNFIELAANPDIVSEDDLTAGYTLDADVGFLWTPDVPSEGIFSVFELARPTFGLVVRNIGEMGFSGSGLLGNDESTEKPEKLYRVIDVGSRWEYPTVWIFNGRGVLDVRDIMHPNFNFRKGLHLGFEFDWTVSSWWKGNYRVGYSQGYWTGGVSAMFTVFNLDLVSYADNVGTKNTPIENRIWMLRASMNF